MACAMAEARHLPELRTAMKGLAVHDRVHFNNESQRRKRLVLSEIREMPVGVLVVVAHRGHGVSEFSARNACLSSVVEQLQLRGVTRLTIESRDDDREDQRHLLRVRRREQPLVFEHRAADSEPLLWVADAIAWAHGAGAGWRQLIEPIVEGVTELRP